MKVFYPINTYIGKYLHVFSYSCDPGVQNNSDTFSATACVPNPCKNGGTCKLDVDDPSGYRCVCPWRYAGLHCESKYEELFELFR